MKLGLREFADVVECLKGPLGNLAAAEKRRATRIPIRARLQVHLIDGANIDRSFSVLAQDISLTGTGVLQTVALQAGREVVIALPRTSGVLYVQAIITHCRGLAEGILACGMEFSKLADEATVTKLQADSTSERDRLQRSILG
jgi:hypothetical protein